MATQEIETCEHNTLEAALPTEDYVVEELSDLSQEKEGFQFYRMPITEEEISVFQNIKMKIYGKCDYEISSDGTPGVVRNRDPVLEKHATTFISNFVEEATKECVDDSVNNEEKTIFKTVLSRIIEDSSEKMKKTDKVLNNAAISFTQSDLLHKIGFLFTQTFTDKDGWHADSHTTDPSIITSDLTFSNAHTLLLDSYGTKNAFNNGCNERNYSLDRNDYCMGLLNTSNPISAPNGPYATHFLGSNIHSVPDHFNDRLFLRLDFYTSTANNLFVN